MANPRGIPTFLKKVKDFSCGEDHAAYIDYNGNVFTWGNGSFGQLGHGEDVSLTVPKKVLGLNQKVRNVSCGGAHTAFITDKNELWMCGRGRDGQLGRGGGRATVVLSQA